MSFFSSFFSCCIPIFFKRRHRPENIRSIHPPCKLPCDLRCSRLTVDSHIRLRSSFPNGHNTHQVLLMGGIEIGQDVYCYSSPVGPLEASHHLLKLWKHVIVWIVPCEMDPFPLNTVQCFDFLLIHQTEIKTLAEIHPCFAISQYFHECVKRLTRCDIGV